MKSLVLTSDRFGFEPEVTARLAQAQGPASGRSRVTYSGRTYEEGKKIGWRDGARRHLAHRAVQPGSPGAVSLPDAESRRRSSRGPLIV